MADVTTMSLARVREAAEQVMAAYGVPGMVVAVAPGDGPVERLAVAADAAGRTLAANTVFPVASVTKLAVALAVLRLVDEGELGLDDPLGQHLPDAAAAVPGVTPRSLLAHTSGLPADVAPALAPYGPGLDWPRLRRACLQTPLRWAPASQVRYGNVEYGLLAVLVERLTGQGFPAALDALVLRPLGLDAWLGEPPRPPAAIADVRAPEAGTPLEPYNSGFWRELALPWCGLLATADAALALVRAFRRPFGFLRPETAAEATRSQTGDLGGGVLGVLVWPRSPWGLGPMLHGGRKPSYAPAGADPGSFGHAGATGCLAWADPAADVAWAILGTRTADDGWLIRGAPAIGAAILGLEAPTLRSPAPRAAGSSRRSA